MVGDFNLDGELLKLVDKYIEIKEEIEIITKNKEDIKDLIKKEMRKKDLKKLKSQLYSVSLSHVQPKERISAKKLKEILVAKGLEKLWNDCLYVPNPYDKLDVRRRKGGQTIF